jgi:uncharacterized membrane protein YhaH (DUF805 family)
MNFDDTFVHANGRTSREHFIPALVVLVAVLAFYAFLVTGRTAQFCMLVLVFPAFVLHARRLHDMGRSAWLLLVPTIIVVAAFAIWLQMFSLGASINSVVCVAALVLFAAFAFWGCVGKAK